MDPIANLARQRTIVAEINELRAEQTEDARENIDVTVTLAYELAELVEALDEWLTKGGFLPTRWRS